MSPSTRSNFVRRLNRRSFSAIAKKHENRPHPGARPTRRNRTRPGHTRHISRMDDGPENYLRCTGTPTGSDPDGLTRIILIKNASSFGRNPPNREKWQTENELLQYCSDARSEGLEMTARFQNADTSLERKRFRLFSCLKIALSKIRRKNGRRARMAAQKSILTTGRVINSFLYVRIHRYPNPSEYPKVITKP